MKINYIDGQTPIDEDELNALKLTHITTVDELNIWELDNIREAEEWARKQSKLDILDEQYIRKLHEKMFCHVWIWAGKYRLTNKNFGVDKSVISTEVKKLLEDVKCWVTMKSFEDNELVARFHHRLVYIHPFPNGNGRHARLITDMMMLKVLNMPLSSWGNNEDLVKKSNSRSQYISALQAADRGDIQPLISFMKG